MSNKYEQILKMMEEFYSELEDFVYRNRNETNRINIATDFVTSVLPVIEKIQKSKGDNNVLRN